MAGLDVLVLNSDAETSNFGRIGCIVDEVSTNTLVGHMAQARIETPNSSGSTPLGQRLSSNFF